MEMAFEAVANIKQYCTPNTITSLTISLTLTLTLNLILNLNLILILTLILTLNFKIKRHILLIPFTP